MNSNDVKAYRAPQLERFGFLSDITAGGSLGVLETKPVGGMDLDQRS